MTDTANEMMELNPAETGKLLDFAIATQKNLFIWGPPGVGKTQVVRQTAERNGLDYMAMHLTLLEPVDLRGMPVVNADRTAVNWVPMGELPRNRDSKGIIHLDELNTADPSVMAAAMQFCLDRKIGDYVLPAGWHIVACGNRVSDGAAARKMPTALADRFSHVTMTVGVDAWTEWALGAGLSEVLIAFLNFRKDLLHSFSSSRTVNTTPRGWQDVDVALKHDPRFDTIEALAYASGRVGKGPVTELRSFVRIWRDLPDIDAILEGRDKTPDAREPAVKYAISMALAGAVKVGQAGNMLDYLDKIGPEFSRTAVFIAMRRNPKITRDPSYQSWVTERMTRFSS